ncbi:MAG: hypothetical protein RL653_1634 [Pseudomonadota bacterium]|jgi:hypothetical protein
MPVRRFGWLLVIWTGWVHAAPTTRVLVTGGDCPDGRMAAHHAALRSALEQRDGQGLGADAALRARLRAAPARTHQELSRAVEAARERYYQADPSAAASTLGAVLAEVGRLPPGEARARLWTDAQLLLGLIHRGSGNAAEGDESFLRVLRVRPDFPLDEDLFSPSVRAHVDGLRASLSRSARVPLDVRSSPPGATVWLDGVSLGRTPWTGEVHAGNYHLQLEHGQLASFPRMLEAHGPATVRVNLAFEGQVVTGVDGAPCLVAADEEARLGHAVLLGALVGADEVAVLQLQREGAEPGWLGVTLLSVPGGERLRAAGLQLELGREPNLSALADWVATGEAGLPLEPAPRPLRAATATGAITSPRVPGRRPAAPLALLGVGAALTGAGVGLQLAADSAARTGTPNEIQQGLAWTALGLGAASLAGAVVLWIALPAEGGSSLSVGAGPGGVSLAGNF